jgi:hypothetical protein
MFLRKNYRLMTLREKFKQKTWLKIPPSRKWAFLIFLNGLMAEFLIWWGLWIMKQIENLKRQFGIFLKKSQKIRIFFEIPKFKNLFLGNRKQRSWNFGFSVSGSQIRILTSKSNFFKFCSKFCKLWQCPK